MTINEAREYLEKVEVKSISIPIKISEADSRYRDCFEFQVVDVKPSTKISPDEILQVYYITREVIDKSQRLFEDLDKKNKQIKR